MKFLNAFGLLLDIIGVLVMFKHTPIATKHTFIYHEDESRAIDKKEKQANNYVKIGLWIILTGFVVQLVASLLN
jgi:hypothetical protein